MEPQQPQTPAMQRQGVLEKLSARFKSLNTAHNTFGEVKKEFDKLTSMGDSVTEDAVISAAAVMVSHGADPHKIASMLADSTDKGPQLASWVAKRDQELQQTQVKILQAREQTRQQLAHGAVVHFAKTVGETMAGRGAIAQPQGAGAPQMQSVSAAPAQPNALGVPTNGG